MIFESLHKKDNLSVRLMMMKEASNIIFTADLQGFIISFSCDSKTDEFLPNIYYNLYIL